MKDALFPTILLLAIIVACIYDGRRAVLHGRRHHLLWIVPMAVGFLALAVLAYITSGGRSTPSDVSFTFSIILGVLFIVCCILACAAILFRSRKSSELEMVHSSQGYLKEKRYAEAEETCRSALKLNSWFVGARYLLGLALMHQGRYEESKQELHKVLSLMPGHTWARYQYGYTFAKLGRYDEAVAQYKKVLSKRLYGDKSQKAKAGLRCNYAIALVENGKPEEAIDVAREVFTLFPNHAKAHYAMGRALLAQGMANAAELQFIQALDIETDFTEARRYREIAAQAADQQKVS